MAVSTEFFFEPPSDEEIEHETESESEEEERQAEAEDSELKEEKLPKKKKTQSPWDFSTYSESVADEHSRRSTTSIDHKISKALERRPIASTEDNDSDVNSDSEPHHQVILFILMIGTSIKRLEFIILESVFVVCSHD